MSGYAALFRITHVLTFFTFAKLKQSWEKYRQNEIAFRKQEPYFHSFERGKVSPTEEQKYPNKAFVLAKIGKESLCYYLSWKMAR